MSSATKAISQQEENRIRPKYSFFTPCPQEHFILVVRGEKLRRIIHNVRDSGVNEDFVFVKNIKDRQPIGFFDELCQDQLGYHFVGVPPFQGMYQYKFTWYKYQIQTGGNASHGITAHEPEIIYITPIESQYALPFEGIEVRGEVRDKNAKEPLIPVGFELTFRVRIVRPMIALMQNRGDWFGGALVPRLQAELKDFCGTFTYEELVRDARNSVSKKFTEYIIGEQGNMSDFRKLLEEQVGVDILHISISGITPNKEYEAANIRRAEAERNADIARTQAEGEKDATIIIAEGKKQEAILLGEGESSRITAEKNAAGEYYRDLLRQRMVGGKLVTLVEGGANTSLIANQQDSPKP